MLVLREAAIALVVVEAILQEVASAETQLGPSTEAVDRLLAMGRILRFYISSPYHVQAAHRWISEVGHMGLLR